MKENNKLQLFIGIMNLLSIVGGFIITMYNTYGVMVQLKGELKDFSKKHSKRKLGFK